MTRLIIIILSGMLLLSSGVKAGTYDYKCTILESSAVDQNGKRKSVYLDETSLC